MSRLSYNQVSETERKYLLDGQPFKAFPSKDKNGRVDHLSVFVSDIEQMLGVLLKDYQEHFFRIELTAVIDVWELEFVELLVTPESETPRASQPALNVNINLEFDELEWTKPYSIRALRDRLFNVRLGIDGFRKWDNDRSLQLRMKVTNPEETLRVFLDRVFNAIEQSIDIVSADLFAELEQNSLVTLFNFPAEVRVSCQQYLQYFVRFLHDVGIKATAKIDERAGQTLFSVTPDDPEEALENIKIALELYLNLPMSTTSSLALPYNADIQSQQLAAQLDHLRADLRLAHVTMQLQKDTIETKNETIDQQRRLIEQQMVAGSIIINSRIGAPQSYQLTGSVSEKKEDKEEIVRGVLSVKDLEKEGVVLHLPELVRRLKEWFKKNRDPE